MALIDEAIGIDHFTAKASYLSQMDHLDFHNGQICRTAPAYLDEVVSAALAEALLHYHIATEHLRPGRTRLTLAGYGSHRIAEAVAAELHRQGIRYHHAANNVDLLIPC